jgi:hypothetical protein
VVLAQICNFGKLSRLDTNFSAFVGVCICVCIFIYTYIYIHIYIYTYIYTHIYTYIIIRLYVYLQTERTNVWLAFPSRDVFCAGSYFHQQMVVLVPIFDYYRSYPFFYIFD